MTRTAKATGLGRESLYKGLSAYGNPEFAIGPNDSRISLMRATLAIEWKLLNKLRLNIDANGVIILS